MSNFSFINEIQSSSTVMQRYIREFFEYAGKAEQNFYGDGRLVNSNVREAAEMLCKIYVFHNNWAIKGEGLSFYVASNAFITKIDNNMQNYLVYIENNTRTNSTTDQQTRLNLLVYLRKLGIIIYQALGGSAVKDAFLEQKLGKGTSPSKSKSVENAFDPKGTWKNSLKQMEDSLRNKKIENQAIHAASKEAIEQIKTDINDIQGQMNSLNERILYKDAFFNAIDNLGKQIDTKMQHGQMEFKRSWEEIHERLKGLEAAESKRDMQLDDLNAKFVIVMDKLDAIDKKQQEQKNFFYSYAEGVNEKITQLIKGNEAQIGKLSASAKKMFSDLLTVTNEIKKSTEEFNHTISEKIKKLESSGRESIGAGKRKQNYSQELKPGKRQMPQMGMPQIEVPRPKLSETVLAKWKKVLLFMRKWMTGRKNKYQIMINAYCITFFVCWFVLSNLFLKEQLPIQNLFVIKIFGLGWYFISWSLYYIALIGAVLAVLRTLAAVIVMLVENRQNWKKCLITAAKTIVFSAILLFIGKYMYDYFYTCAYDVIGWKDILLASDLSYIHNGIEWIFDIWRRSR